MRKILAVIGLLSLFCVSAIQAQTVTSQLSITPNASAYTSGYCLGGVQYVPNMIVAGGLGGTIITGVDIIDNTATNATIDIWIFNKLPTGTYTDHAGCTVASADQPYLVGVIYGALATCSSDSAGTTGMCQSTPAVPISASSYPPTPALYMVPVVRGTPTYGSTKTLLINIKALPDSAN